MGRVDALTQLEKPPVSPSTPPDMDTSQKPENLKVGLPENLKTSSPDFRKTRLPEILNTRKPENLKARNLEKAEKYSTQLQPSLINKIKQHALEHDVKDYEVIQEAVYAYLNKKQKPENLKT